ncbi:MAG: hypothetical protein OXE95_11940, partial [Chloroflexi bacterium]|nr:hypothetical protein [Chloroflexota bacterium]
MVTVNGGILVAMVSLPVCTQSAVNVYVAVRIAPLAGKPQAGIVWASAGGTSKNKSGRNSLKRFISHTASPVVDSDLRGGGGGGGKKSTNQQFR